MIGVANGLSHFGCHSVLSWVNSTTTNTDIIVMTSTVNMMLEECHAVDEESRRRLEANR